MPAAPLAQVGGGAANAPTFVSNPSLDFPIVNESGQRVDGRLGGDLALGGAACRDDADCTASRRQAVRIRRRA